MTKTESVPGYFVKMKNTPHSCPVPSQTPMSYGHGSLWRCAECSLLWQFHARHVQVLSEGVWKPANLINRLRYRNVGRTNRTGSRRHWSLSFGSLFGSSDLSRIIESRPPIRPEPMWTTTTIPPANMTMKEWQRSQEELFKGHSSYYYTFNKKPKSE